MPARFSGGVGGGVVAEIVHGLQKPARFSVGRGVVADIFRGSSPRNRPDSVAGKVTAHIFEYLPHLL